MARPDDPHNGHQDDSRYGPSWWPAGLQFIWGLLNDRRRVGTLVFLLAAIVLALLTLKGAYAGVTYDLAQHVPHWVATSLLAGGVGTSIVASFVFSVYRRARRRLARLAGKRPAIKAVEETPAEENEHGLGKPGER
jgi:hypothetical protein